MPGHRCALVAVLFCAVQAAAQSAPGLPPSLSEGQVPPAEGRGIFEIVKRFDFNERELGNFEDVPMYWERLIGEGLPRYSYAEFDDEYGHFAPPSFVFRLRGGNIAYEYRQDDITVQPGTEYLLVGYIRAVGLQHARAFVQAYFVDRFGNPIEGTDQVSQLVASLYPESSSQGETGEDVPDEPWQRVELTLRATSPDADALRLRFWVMQTYVWEEPPPDAIDPIVRQDVSATVWFDDFTLYCLPHVSLNLSDPGGVVIEGRESAAILEVRSATPEPLPVELRILDGRGGVRLSERYEISGQMPPLSCPLPELEPGRYAAEVWLGDDRERFRYRELAFVVAAALEDRAEYPADFGIDMGRWRAGDVAGALGLVRELRCGALKVGLPICNEKEAEAHTREFIELREFVEQVSARNLAVVGVLLPPEDAVLRGLTTARVLQEGLYGRYPYGPVLAHLGGLLPVLQLGSEPSELASGATWSSEQLLNLRRDLRRYVTAPELVLPCSVFDARLAGLGAAGWDTGMGPGSPNALSVPVPVEVPARDFPYQLAFLARTPGGKLPGGAASQGNLWLRLEPPPQDWPAGQRRLDLARRVVLAKALASGPIYLPAPFVVTRAGGELHWTPTEDYLPLRTWFHYLSGKWPAAVMPLPERDSLAIFFEGPDESCVVVWTWQAQPLPEPLALYLGPDPQEVDELGRRKPCPVVAGKAQLPLRPRPTLVTGVDTPLALLQASFGLEPDFVEVHRPDPPPVLHLRNAFDAELVGKIQLLLPELWQASPTEIDLTLAPGAALAQPIRLTLPPRELAGRRRIGVQVTLTKPVTEVLTFEAALNVGLRGLEVEATAHWEGDTLVVVQVLGNSLTEEVNFAAFCRASGYPQMDRAFLKVAPGERRRLEYRLPGARRLAGRFVRVGLREIQGPRTLDQLVEIPP